MSNNNKDSFLKTTLAAPNAERLTATTQLRKYHNSVGGHGFAAEDANILNRRLHGEKVVQTGWSNEKNGADYISNKIYYQVKYYASADKSVNSAFGNGRYKYPGMKLEVPKDQYDKAVEVFADKIRNGEVFDELGRQITDPAKAKDFIEKGSVTYQQARNIAKAGTIESLSFDAVNGAVISLQTAGISFLVSLGFAVWSGADFKGAAMSALQNALAAGAVTGIATVVASQIARTQVGGATTLFMREGVRGVYSTAAGKELIHQLASFSLGKSVYGAAAVGHVSKIMSSSVVTAAAATVVTTAPDFYRALISKNISWTQFSKNFATNVAGAAGGVGGWVGGAAAGAAVGSFFPFIGTTIGGIVGGVVGAVAGGTSAGYAAKGIADLIAPDDAERMHGLLNDEASQKAYEYMLTKKEGEILSEKINSFIENYDPVDFFKDMYGSGEYNSTRREWAARKVIIPACESLLAKRSFISDRQVEESIAYIAHNAGYAMS